MSDLMQFWPVIALATPLVLAAAGWAIRMGLASKRDLEQHADAEEQARSDAIRSLGADIDRRLTQIESVQDSMSNRTLVIETEIQHLPSSEDIAEIKQELAAAKARWDGFDRDLQSVSRALTRVENHLLKGAIS